MPNDAPGGHPDRSRLSGTTPGIPGPPDGLQGPWRGGDERRPPVIPPPHSSDLAEILRTLPGLFGGQTRAFSGQIERQDSKGRRENGSNVSFWIERQDLN
jgi:hypothetical protein